jgi:catechol 2,3-dioxygenase-like lactoylglutathione lyase family enzyme
MIRLGQTIPALPVHDAATAADFYREHLSFDVVYQDRGFAVLRRDEAALHLWEASDESWRTRASLENPVTSGAESFLAGTASCRVSVEGVDQLYSELQGSDILHPASRNGVEETGFGTREFATLDLDGNLITFFHRLSE